MTKTGILSWLVLLGMIAVPHSSLAAFGDTPCYECHEWDACNGQNMTCGSCHAAPPATGAHPAHFNGALEQAVYGDTRITEDFAATSNTNIIGCGNCHPMDRNSHGNGTWGDIELYNPAAPAGTIKSRNTTAVYDSTTKTCSNVYCHSYNKWTTDGPVFMPWPPPEVWDPAVDPLPRPLPDNIITTRMYSDVSWNSGAALGCDGCHANPPATTYVDNDGGAGDSHYWVDPYGYSNLHAWNMAYYYEPVYCRTCHYETVREPSPWHWGPGVDERIYDAVPLYNKAKHVNGKADVAFDTVNGFTYDSGYSSSITYLLANATYDPLTKTCSNVGCHNGFGNNVVKKIEDHVTWGTPYRWWDSVECDRCHGNL